MAGPSGFERLPGELRQWLFSYCDSSTILHLCLTSKAVYDACASQHPTIDAPDCLLCLHRYILCSIAST